MVFNTCGFRQVKAHPVTQRRQPFPQKGKCGSLDYCHLDCAMQNTHRVTETLTEASVLCYPDPDVLDTDVSAQGIGVTYPERRRGLQHTTVPQSANLLLLLGESCKQWFNRCATFITIFMTSISLSALMTLH